MEKVKKTGIKMGVDYQLVIQVKWFFEQNIKSGSKNSDF